MDAHQGVQAERRQRQNLHCAGALVLTTRISKTCNQKHELFLVGKQEKASQDCDASNRIRIHAFDDSDNVAGRKLIVDNGRTSGFAIASMRTDDIGLVTSTSTVAGMFAEGSLL